MLGLPGALPLNLNQRQMVNVLSVAYFVCENFPY